VLYRLQLNCFLVSCVAQRALGLGGGWLASLAWLHPDGLVAGWLLRRLSGSLALTTYLLAPLELELDLESKRMARLTGSIGLRLPCTWITC